MGQLRVGFTSSNEVDETGAYYTEWSKPERKKHQYSILTHIYGI